MKRELPFGVTHAVAELAGRCESHILLFSWCLLAQHCVLCGVFRRSISMLRRRLVSSSASVCGFYMCCCGRPSVSRLATLHAPLEKHSVLGPNQLMASRRSSALLYAACSVRADPSDGDETRVPSSAPPRHECCSARKRRRTRRRKQVPDISAARSSAGSRPYSIAVRINRLLSFFPDLLAHPFYISEVKLSNTGRSDHHWGEGLRGELNQPSPCRWGPAPLKRTTYPTFQ